MSKEELDIIMTALKDASILLSEEYQTLGDDDLREEYDKTMKELQNAIEIANEYV